MPFDAMRYVQGSATGFAVWSSVNKGVNTTLSNGSRTAASTSYGGELTRSDTAISGKRYFEVSFVPNADGVGVGIALSAGGLGSWIGGPDGLSYGYYLPSGSVYMAAAVIYSGASDATTPATVGIAFDSATMSCWVRRADGAGWEGGGDPVAGASPTFTAVSGTYYPACTPYITGSGACTINAGQDPFVMWTPSGGFAGF